MKLNRYFLILIIFITLILPYSALANNLIIGNSINIPNFHKVDDIYYRSGQPKENDFKDIANIGIKTVVDLRMKNKKRNTFEQNTANKYGIKYFNIPIIPGTKPNREKVDNFFNIINNPKNLPVLVHCWHGKDRTGIMTALYRSNKYGWNFEKAYQEMLKMGFHPHIFYRQKKWLYEWMREKPINRVKR